MQNFDNLSEEQVMNIVRKKINFIEKKEKNLRRTIQKIISLERLKK